MALEKVSGELAELVLSGKSEAEMEKDLDEMAKKLVETGYSRQFDEENVEDKELYEKMKQYLTEKLEAMVSYGRRGGVHYRQFNDILRSQFVTLFALQRLKNNLQQQEPKSARGNYDKHKCSMM